jgi:predicted dehydrogenase
MAKQLDVGVVGVGTFGMMHVQAYGDYDRSKLKAVCDLDRAKGKELAQRFGCDYYDNYEEMFSKAGLDAVSIATPDFLHRDPAVSAAEAGLDILLEKPMATTVDDAEAILRAAGKSGSKLMVDFHNRFSPPFVSLKQSIEKGEMGDPEFIQARLNDTIYVPTQMLSWSGRSNVLWFLGSHVIDLSRWLLDSDPRRVFSLSGSGRLSGMGIDTPDFYQSLLEFENGSVASLENCWILPESHPSVFDFHLEFVGSEGSFTANVSHSDMAEKFTGEGRTNPDLMAAFEIHGRQMGFAKLSIWHFVDCVLDDLPPVATGGDGLWATKAVCGLLESARTGIPVPVE